jgi:CTP synthase (UTP-ammonia lyase)
VTAGAARIALIGDYDPAVVAHQGIPLALDLAGDAASDPIDWTWIHTSTLAGDLPSQLSAFDGVWVVPGSPYASTTGAIAAIRFAREGGVPFLGTCGGFQHALLEYAEAVWGVVSPAHAETDPDAPEPVIAALTCKLIEQGGGIFFAPGSRLHALHGAQTVEGYHCGYGLNPLYAVLLDDGPLRATGRDADGDVRAIELDGHPFFVATLYQPERSGLAGQPHPLIGAFADAARAHAAGRGGR